MSNLSISAQRELRQAQNELMELSNKQSLTAAEKRKFESLLATISLLKSGAISDEVRYSEAEQLAKEYGLGRVEPTAEARKRNEERSMMRKILANSGEYRTYSPLVANNSPYIAQQFVDILAETQKSAGPLFAGSAAVSNVYCEAGNSGPAKLPTLPDESATGFEQTEASTESDGVYSPSNISFKLRRWSSGIVLYSMELSDDVTEFDSFQNILAHSLGVRLGRIQNSSFLTSLLTALSSNSSASISSGSAGIIEATDVEDLVGGIDAGYLQNPNAKPGFLMSRDAQTKIGKLATSGGLRVFPKALAAQPSILDFPVYVSASCDSVATGNKPVIFGDFSTVIIRSIHGVEIRTFSERYVDQGSFALLARKRSDLQYAIPSTSDSALKYLTIS